MDMSMGDVAASPASPAHDHSAHAEHGTGVIRNPDGTYAYSHGAWLGHIVPGSFFLFWGAWWTATLFVSHLESLARRKPFLSRTWQALPAGPARLRSMPLEPALKILLPLLGIAGELRLGHSRYQALYAADGKFDLETIRDWQHSSMYLAFVASGVADLCVLWANLPEAIGSAFLALSFVVEGVLLVFHLKGPAIEIRVHLILVLHIFATALAVLFEASRRHSFVAACVRPFFTMIQGAWWIQTAFIMYRSAPAWDPDYMGSEMVAPVVCCLHLIIFAIGMLVVYTCAKTLAEKRLGRALDGSSTLGDEDFELGAASLELAALTGGSGGARVKPRY